MQNAVYVIGIALLLLTPSSCGPSDCSEYCRDDCLTESESCYEVAESWQEDELCGVLYDTCLVTCFDDCGG
ncbi:MAG: hypothetical protein ABFR47_09410 [Verrucomicrobiota bacterium]